MVLRLAIFFIFMSVGPAFALDASVCGDPPPVADEELKGELKGRAEFLSRFLGDAALSGQIETSRKEIFSKYPDAERSRSNAYFQYQVCAIIMDDQTLTTQQKLDELIRIRKEFSKEIMSEAMIEFPKGISGKDKALLAVLYTKGDFHIEGEQVSAKNVARVAGMHEANTRRYLSMWVKKTYLSTAWIGDRKDDASYWISDEGLNYLSEKKLIE